MEKPTLIILAAGMGSRYGGLKQMDVFTPEGDTIIDFSIYDAIQAGFGKIVFIIRKHFEENFRKSFDSKLKGKIQVAYVFQEIDSVPKKYINNKRTKPWGTGHALLMAKDAVKENFAVINADDFYGREAFKVMAKALLKTDKTSYNFNTIAYLLKNTISEYGFVSRGECLVSNNDFLINVTEHTHIEKINGELMSKNNNTLTPINENTIVSMNFWGFTPKCFDFGEELFEIFLKENRENLKAEFYIPTVVNEALKSGLANIKVLKSNAKWFGVTYKEDKKVVESAIKNLKKQNIYPTKLW